METPDEHNLPNDAPAVKIRPVRYGNIVVKFRNKEFGDVELK